MASVTKVFMARVRFKTRNAGRKRKNQLNSRGTTPTQAAFFGDLAEGEPKQANKAGSAKSNA